MARNILPDELPRCLSLWWDFCRGFREIFSFFWCTPFLILSSLFTSCEFLTPALAGAFQWSLSDNKSLQVSPILLTILADLIKAIVWIVSILPSISKCYNLPFKPFWDRSKCTNYNWYDRHCHVPLFFVVLWQRPSTFPFYFLLFSLYEPPE